MTNDSEHDDLFNELRAANPFVAGGQTPDTTTSPEARIKEITMDAPTTHTTPLPRRSPAAAPPPWWRRPAFAAPTAFAALAITAVGVIAVTTVHAPSANALVIEAAQNSAQFDSGKVQVEIELREVPDEDFVGSIVSTTRFDGTDFASSEDLSAFATGSAELELLETIRVGDNTYSSLPGLTIDGQFLELEAAGGDPFAETFGGFVNPETITPGAIVAVLERADDFTEVGESDNSTSYRGAVPLSVLEELGPAELPPGLSLLAEGGSDDLPETIDITATVTNGNIDQLVIDIIGDTPAGFADATITTTFTELGEPQEIVAPPQDQIVTFADLNETEGFGMSEGAAEAFEVMEDLQERRPGLCEEVFGGFDDLSDGDPVIDDADSFDLMNEAFASCLTDAGEPEAADAFRTIAN